MAGLTAELSLDDPITRSILRVSEDGLTGFVERPFAEVARRSGLPEAQVLERTRELLAAGVIRRIRLTLNTQNLAHGALVAWNVPAESLQDAFDTLSEQDPFSGHVVIRSTDGALAGSTFRLWTTLKVPQGYSIEHHAAHMAGKIGAVEYRLMPARCLFALGVGHVRRRELEPGSRADTPAAPMFPDLTRLSDGEWAVLGLIKEPLAVEEIVEHPWEARAERAGLSWPELRPAVESLAAKGLFGRFSTFLEHVKPLSTGERVTRYNALFHWAVPPGEELRAGAEVGRHHIITHAYWREGGPAFGNVNVMAVAHGTEKELVLQHKAAIDAHLAEAGIDVGYTAVFWGGRSEIKPSEVLPAAYEAWCHSEGIDPATMREENV
jgi:hypothetical protein